MSIKTLIYFSLFFVIIACTSPSKQHLPTAQKGIIDLSQLDLDKQIFSLNGEWLFYFGAYIPTKQLFAHSSEKHYVSIKNQGGNWNGWPWNDSSLGNFGYATFGLQVILPTNLQASIGLKIPPPNNSYRLYLNGQLLGSAGKAGKTRYTTSPEFTPQIIQIPSLSTDTLNLVLHVANFHHRKGGLSGRLMLGKKEVLQSQSNHTIWRTLFLLGTFFMMGVYHLFLFALYRKDVSSLYFALICFVTLGRSLVLDEMFIKELIPGISWEWMLKIEYLGFFGNILFAALFIRAIFPQKHLLNTNRLVVLLNALCLMLVFTTPARIHSFLFPYAYILIPLIILVFSNAAITMVRQQAKGVLIFLLGNLIVCLTIINDVFYNAGLINTTNLIFAGVFVYFFSQSLFIAQKFSAAFFRSEDSSKKLKNLNETLELRVSTRTHELKHQKDAINEKNLKLETQAKRINDSIKVAEHIQQAILPDHQQLSLYLNDYFLIYRPKDIVSGDFYWLTQVQQQTIMVVGDCTGHGVPGAMLTMMGKMLLDKIVTTQQITSPATITQLLNQEINTALAKDKTYNQHGMDIAVFSLQPKVKDDRRKDDRKKDDRRKDEKRKDNNTRGEGENIEKTLLTFSGAKTDLYYIPPGLKAIQSLKGSRKAVGGEFHQHLSFENCTVTLTKGTMIYVGTDGLADQNNHRRKRFGSKLLYKLLEENAHLSLEKQQTIIEEALDLHMDKSEQRDDILWLGFRV